VERVLGRGGMGEVLLAHDTLLRRPVALKHVRADGPQAADRRHAILTEARRASQVRDHRIAAIHDVLDLGDDVLIVMEYVEGETLRERLREPLPLETFWRVAGECVEALRAAHAQGVIHRDIKPENLMLTRGDEIKILDFGVALRSERHPAEFSPDDSTSSMEQTRRPAGTPRYMAPEAHYGGHIDERTDLFSLGAVFYEMLTARHPFAGGGYATVLDHIMNTPAEPASSANPDVPEPLSRVIERMLARDPAQRYASCEDVAVALHAARTADAGGSRVAEAPPPYVAAAVVPRAPRAVEQASRPADATPAPGRKPVFRALAAIAVGVVAIGLAPQLLPPSLPADRHLALLLPATPGAKPEFAALALGTLELVAARIQRHQDEPGFQVAPFAESLSESPDSPADARKKLGANLTLVSRLEARENDLVARLELRETVDGRRVALKRIRVPQADLRAFAESLYVGSLRLLQIPRRPAGREPGLGVRGAGTMRFLAEGIGRSRLARSEDEFSRARDALELACRAEPGAAVPRAWMAWSQLQAFERTKAPNWLELGEASARRAVALDEARSEGHRLLGEALVLRKRPAEALAEFRRASELDPSRDDVWMGQGKCLRLLGDPAGERAVYVAAAERRPHAFRPRWWLAHWAYRQARADEAVAAYREVLKRAPDFAKCYSGLGAILVLQGEYQRAVDTLLRAVALRPLPSAYSNLGTAYFLTDRFDRCVDAYNQALQFGDATYLLWFNLGDAYYWLRGDSLLARPAYETMLQLGREEMRRAAERGDPLDPMIPAHAATAFPKLGLPDSARVHLAWSLAADSANAMVLYCAALTTWQLGERELALTWLERAVAAGYPRAWLRDSPVHRDWRTQKRFTALLTPVSQASQTTPSPTSGGR
jgi:tetratricopeptide (TPR) repeat protein/predicted Ser/Thr protein kinase